MTTREKTYIFALPVFALLLLFSCRAFAYTINYQYDDLYRLTAEIRSDGVMTSYQYDAAGNRLARSTTSLVSGDLNGDGLITAADAIMTLQVISGITPHGAIYMSTEIGGNGRVDMGEALYILRQAAGLQ